MLKVSTKTKSNVFLNQWERRAYPHLYSEGFLLLSELHSSTAPRAKVLRCSNHLSILKLQILHQQLQRNTKCDTTCFNQCCTLLTHFNVSIEVNRIRWMDHNFNQNYDLNILFNSSCISGSIRLDGKFPWSTTITMLKCLKPLQAF